MGSRQTPAALQHAHNLSVKLNLNGKSCKACLTMQLKHLSNIMMLMDDGIVMMTIETSGKCPHDSLCIATMTTLVEFWSK